MDFFIANTDITNTQLWIYNISMIVYFFFLFRKYGKYDVATYIIHLFTIGIFSDIGRVLGFDNMGIHIYFVIAIISGIFLLHKYKFRSDNKTLIFFLLFVSYFLFDSIFIHSDSILLVISQLLKYIIPVIAFFIVDSYTKYTKGRSVLLLHNVIKDLIVAQIIFCIIKLCVLQATQEGLVGSLTGVNGGGAGTSFPMLALLWLAYVTKMRFSKKFFLLVLGLLFIGFMTGKRAIWFIFPIEFLVLFLYYRAKDIALLFKYLVPAFILTSVFIYFGLRLSPTLNPENKVWGSFDLEYAYDYALKYSGGDDEGESIEKGKGRLGATLLLWESIIDVSNYDKQILFGVGNEQMVYYDKEDYNNRDANFGVNHRGSITAIVMMYFILGILGVALFLLYFLRICVHSTRDRFKWIVILVVLYDFIFYNGQMIRNVPMQSMLFILLITTKVNVKGKTLNLR